MVYRGDYTVESITNSNTSIHLYTKNIMPLYL